MIEFPSLHTQVAVAYCTVGREHLVDHPFGDQLSSFVWDLQDPNTPEHVLMPANLILSLHFSPKDSKVQDFGSFLGCSFRLNVI